MPKLLLVFLIWILVTVSAIASKFKEIDQDNLLWSSSWFGFISWALSATLLLYSLYLLLIVSKALRYLNYMRSNFKLVFFLTLVVISIGIAYLMLYGIESFISENTSLFSVVSIGALINFYTLIISYIYAPSRSGIFT